MLNYQQWGSVAFRKERFHMKCSKIPIHKTSLKMTLYNYCCIFQGSMINLHVHLWPSCWPRVYWWDERNAPDRNATPFWRHTWSLSHRIHTLQARKKLYCTSEIHSKMTDSMHGISHRRNSILSKTKILLVYDSKRTSSSSILIIIPVIQYICSLTTISEHFSKTVSVQAMHILQQLAMLSRPVIILKIKIKWAFALLLFVRFPSSLNSPQDHTETWTISVWFLRVVFKSAQVHVDWTLIVLNFNEMIARGMVPGIFLTCVGSHFLLGNEHLLGTVDDEVASRIQRALVQLCKITICESVE